MKQTKVSYTFKINPSVLEKLKKKAIKQNRSFNNLVETILLKESSK